MADIKDDLTDDEFQKRWADTVKKETDRLTLKKGKKPLTNKQIEEMWDEYREEE